MVERLNGIQEVAGSTPTISTTKKDRFFLSFFVFILSVNIDMIFFLKLNLKCNFLHINSLFFYRQYFLKIKTTPVPYSKFILQNRRFRKIEIINKLKIVNLRYRLCVFI